MTCVTDVEVAPDLKSCKVWISTLGDDAEREDTLKGLRNAEGFLRSQLASSLNLRNTPELRFIADTSIEYGMKMNRLIDDVKVKDDNEDAM